MGAHVNPLEITPAEMDEAVRLALLTTYSMTEDEQRAAERAVRRAATDRDVRVEVFANVARQAIADQRADRAARVRMAARDPAEQAAP